MIYFYHTKFNTLWYMYTVQSTALLKSNRIFGLIIGITIGNFLLMVSKEGEDHLWFILSAS